MWWWQSGCRGFPWASRPVRILSRPSRFHLQSVVELGGWCCKVIATRFVLVLNEHSAFLVNALLYPVVSYRNRNQDAPAAATTICPYGRESYWGEISHFFWIISNLCIRVKRVKNKQTRESSNPEPEEHTLSSMSWDIIMTVKNWPILQINMFSVKKKTTFEFVFICPGNTKTASGN